jgi:hypothetical protein
MYASNAMANADRNYLSYCQKMMDKDRSDRVISSSNLTTEVPEGRIKKMTYDNIFVIEDHNHKQYKMILNTIKKNTKNDKPLKVTFDSGASKTYFNDRKRLTSFQYKRRKGYLGNETTIICYGQGDYRILRNVS